MYCTDLNDLAVGTMVKIPGRKTPVRVTSVDTIGSTVYAYTTSGRVQPRSFEGGCLTQRGADLTWQPTLQQQTVFIAGFEVLGLAN